MTRFTRAAASITLAVAAAATPATAAAPPPPLTGPLGAALTAAGLADVPGLALTQNAIPGVAFEVASVYAVAGTATTLTVLRAPATAADALPYSIWLRSDDGVADAAWVVEQTDADGTSIARSTDVPTSARAGITGCDVAGEIVGQLLKMIPGIGLLVSAACSAPGPEGGLRWAWYDPIFPQTPGEYYDKGQRSQPWVGDAPTWQIFDVRYKSHRCFTREMLTVLSQKPQYPYRGALDACVSVSDSDLMGTRYVYVDAQYWTDIVWIDGTRQATTFTTSRNDTWAPHIQRQNRLVPTGDYTGTGTTREYWPSFCGPTYSPNVDPRTQYACKTGQVRDHVRVVRTF